jgi:HD superfamily phosphohydrolase
LNKKKIFNDPVYGFVNIPFDVIFDLIEHPYFQRLRRIQQLGLTHLVFPGAMHSRFHHAIGAMHLMGMAIDVLRSKGHHISHEEAEAATIAILLHDIGHGPYSHVLEHSLVSGVTHEDLSLILMNRLNEMFGGRLTLAIRIFRNDYAKKFLHQLVSSQLDMDRLDYLSRDSFYTGVSEGVVSTDRIIKMLDIYNQELAIEAKGIYSIEKFIIARRLMYWQVYLHKTVISAEQLLIKILMRAKELVSEGADVYASPALRVFLSGKVTGREIETDNFVFNCFAELDDFDIFASLKLWKTHDDPVLSLLSANLIQRKLYKIRLENKPFDEIEVKGCLEKLKKTYGFSHKEESYYVFTGIIENNAYNTQTDKINILYKDGSVRDIAEASDQLNISVLSTPVIKQILCFMSN